MAKAYLQIENHKRGIATFLIDYLHINTDLARSLCLLVCKALSTDIMFMHVCVCRIHAKKYVIDLEVL